MAKERGHLGRAGPAEPRVLARLLHTQPCAVTPDEVRPPNHTDAVEFEPLRGVDAADLIFALNQERGSTLFLVTHEERLAQRCDRIARMADGRIVSDTVKAPVTA